MTVTRSSDTFIDIDVTGGAINNATLGLTTPAAAKVTTFTATTSVSSGTLSSGTYTLANGANIVLGTTTGTTIGTASAQLLSFYGVTPVDRPAAMSTGLTTLTVVAAATPDFNIQALTAGSPSYAFVTSDEAQSVLQVLLNLQTRVDEIEARLEELGLIRGN